MFLINHLFKVLVSVIDLSARYILTSMILSYFSSFITCIHMHLDATFLIKQLNINVFVSFSSSFLFLLYPPATLTLKTILYFASRLNYILDFSFLYSVYCR